MTSFLSDPGDRMSREIYLDVIKRVIIFAFRPNDFLSQLLVCKTWKDAGLTLTTTMKLKFIKHTNTIKSFYSEKTSYSTIFPSNKLYGDYIRYGKNDIILAREYYLYDLKHGEFVEYYSTGKQMSYGIYKYGELEGFQKSYYSTGRMSEYTEYSKGKKNGKHITYHENGKIKTEGMRKDDILVGEQKEYNENGQMIKHYITTTRNKNDFNKTWWDNGNLQSEEHHDASGSHRIYKKYDYVGKLIEEYSYTYGERNGPFRKVVPGRGKPDMWREGVYRNDRLYRFYYDYESNGGKLLKRHLALSNIFPTKLK